MEWNPYYWKNIIKRMRKPTTWWIDVFFVMLISFCVLAVFILWLSYLNAKGHI